MLPALVRTGLLIVMISGAAGPGVRAFPQFARTSPSIAKVTPITAQAIQTITITGIGFGSHAAYSNQDIPYLAIRDKTAGWAAGRATRSNFDAITLSVGHWTDSEIVVTGLEGAYGGRWQLNNGDQVEIAVWNAQTNAGPATYKLVVGAGGNLGTSGPTVASVTPITPQATQTIVIRGSGFGVQTPFNGDSLSIMIDDLTRDWRAGCRGRPECGPGDNRVTLRVASWTDSEIRIEGFTGTYAPLGPNVLNTGDRVEVWVWNVQSGVGPATFNLTVGSAANSIPASSSGVASQAPRASEASPQAIESSITAKLIIVHSFPSDAPSGLGPLIQGHDGDFYGVFGFEYPANLGKDLSAGCQVFGGSCGSVYRLDPRGNLIVLHSFSLRADGGFPHGALVEGTDGDFYGATTSGGMTKCPADSTGCGTIFRIDAARNLRVLHAFSGRDGAAPAGSLLQTGAGQFYGVTTYGGTSSSCQGGCGVIFKIDSKGSFTLLHSFTGADGANPAPGLAQAGDGNFYGAAAAGGAHNKGVVFRINASGSLTVLHSFSGPDGAVPNGGLVQSSDGYLLGTTSSGGTSGQGTVFAVSTSGGFTVLHSLSGADGSSPMAPVSRATDGNFYGTTMGQGGNNCAGSSCGSVFSIDRAGNFHVVYAFTAADGGFPETGVTQGKDGTFYGTTSQGGSDGAGSVFELAASPGKGVQGEDATIISDIESKLWQDSTLKSQDIRVGSQNGTVTLEGTVASAADKRRVEQIAQSEKGVKLIIDRLAVAEMRGSAPR